MSSHLITNVGYSHLINFCFKFDLPQSDVTLKATSFTLFQIFNPKEIKQGSGAWLMFDQTVDYIRSNEDTLSSR